MRNGLIRRRSLTLALDPLDINCRDESIESVEQEGSAKSTRSNRISSGAQIIPIIESNRSQECQVESHSRPFSNHLFDISTIPCVAERDILIPMSSLYSLEFLIYGSNSTVSKAKLAKKGKVILKLMKKEPINRDVASKEYECEHDALARIR